MTDMESLEYSYQFSLQDRFDLLLEAGFTRDDEGIWSHADGRAIGESVVAAITDASLLRYLKPERRRKKKK